MNIATSLKEKNIIRFDDHQIVLDGFTQWCQREYQEMKVRTFKNSDEVFFHIVSHLIKDEKIDLFITDYAHGGINGYEMSNAIRALERALNRPQMPILLITLYGKDHPLINDGLEEGVFTRYLSLNIPPEELIECIEKMIEG